MAESEVARVILLPAFSNSEDEILLFYTIYSIL